MKYTLTCEEGNFKNTVNFEEVYLPSVLENMELFLRGCGFYFEGKLEFVDDNYEFVGDGHDGMGSFAEPTVTVTNLRQTDMFDSMDLQHAPNYYDTERNK